MTVLVTCKFEDDSNINPWESSRASNSEVNSPIWPEIELAPDFMTVFVTCKFDKDPIKMKSPSSGQHFLIISLWELSARH